MSSYNIDHQVVKKPHNDQPLSTEEEKELIMCAFDIEHFLRNHVYIQNPSKGSVLFEPRSYQSRIIQTLVDDQYIIGKLPRQSGKALSLDTPIPTPEGWTTMGDISVGDVIFDNNGKPTTVLGATETMYNHNCYQITFDNGETVVADEDHLWTAYHSDWQKRTKTERYNIPRTLTTKELAEKHDTSGKTNTLYLYRNKEIEYTKKQLDIHPYILGVWLGDGNSRDARITGSEVDLNEIKAIFEIFGYSSSSLRPSNTAYNMNVIELRKALKSSDLIHNKHIPTDYMRSSKKDRIQLLRGLMDSDGSCSKYNGSCEFYQKNYDLIIQVRELLSSLGIKSRVREKLIDSQIYYTLSFCTRKFYVFNLKRKRDSQKLCKNHPKNNRYHIHKIEQVDSVPVRCIKVDNEQELFLFGETMLPTHNSTLIAAYMLHQANFFNDMKIGIASNKLVNAKEIIDRIKYMYENLEFYLKTPVIEYNKQSVRFSNNSSIEVATTTESTFRGKSLNRIMLDEFAFVKPSVAEEFWTSLLPTISAEGNASKDTKLIIISTPNGTEGTYADLWFGAENGDNGFTPVSIEYDEIPGRDDEFKHEMIQKMGHIQFLQEFCCHFISNKGTLINSLKLESLKHKDPIDVGEDFKLFTNDLRGRTIALAADVGEGIGQDYHAVQMVDIDTFEQIGEYRNNEISQSLFTIEFINMMKYLYKHGVKDIYYTIENNGLGKGVINLIKHSEETVLQKAHMISHDSKKPGFVMSTTNKMKGCADLKDLIETDRLKINSRKLISELKFFVKSGQTYKAESGKHDDLVMSMVIMMLLIGKIAKFEDTVYEKYNSLDDVDYESDNYSEPMGIVF